MKPCHPSSDTARAMNDPNRPPRVGTAKYPWHSLKVLESFHVAPNEANFTTISTSCYKWSKKLGKKFRAIDYGEKGIEVARLE